MIYNKSLKLDKNNKFIVIDGINGTGKTTLIKNLEKYFLSKEEKITLGKEPGGTPAGDELRKIVLETKQKLTPETQFFIMSASRSEYIDKAVKESIKKNEFFISDRYYYSSLAFQSYAGGLDFDFIYNVSKVATKNTFPNIVFILDLDIKKAFERINKRNESTNEKDNFESEELIFHQKVRDGFLDMTSKLPECFYVVDASKNENEILNEVTSIIEEIYF